LKELRIAVFGESGAGKSALLASLFAAHNPVWGFGRSPLQLVAESPTKGLDLNRRWDGMAQLRFPPGTDRFDEWRFVVQDPAHGPLFRLAWFDYPGGWLSNPSSRVGPGLGPLIGAHAGIIVIDGQKLLPPNGAAYLSNLFERLAAQLPVLAGSNQKLRSRRDWLIAVSKADSFREGSNAFELQRQVAAYFFPQLDRLASAAGGRFGDRWIVFSALGPPGWTNMAALQRTRPAPYGVAETLAAVILTALFAETKASIEAASTQGALATTVDWLNNVLMRLMGRETVPHASFFRALEVARPEELARIAVQVAADNRRSELARANALWVLANRLMDSLNDSKAYCVNQPEPAFLLR